MKYTITHCKSPFDILVTLDNEAMIFDTRFLNELKNHIIDETRTTVKVTLNNGRTFKPENKNELYFHTYVIDDKLKLIKTKK